MGLSRTFKIQTIAVRMHICWVFLSSEIKFSTAILMCVVCSLESADINYYIGLHIISYILPRTLEVGLGICASLLNVYSSLNSGYIYIIQ